MLTIKITVNANSFEFIGETPFADVRALIELWFNALDADHATQARADALAARSRAASASLAAHVAAYTPSTLEFPFTRSPLTGDVLMLDLTKVEAAVAEEETVNASAATLLKQLFDAVEAAKADPVALQALVDRGRAASAALSAAVVANTPAA